MSALSTVASPLKVGANTAVLRGIGKLSKAERGTPERVYSVYDSP